MDLEKKVNGNKQGLLKKIARKAMPLIFAGLGLAIVGCKEVPGPISVQNTVTPSSIESGSYGNWKVKVTNYGGEVTIDSASVHEEAISGWAVGYYDISSDIPLTTTTIPAHSTETIFNTSFLALNTGYDNFALENTVTVNSNCGEDSDSCTYRVISPYSSSSSTKGNREEVEMVGAVHELSDYVSD